jgi:hypothetical protein
MLGRGFLNGYKTTKISPTQDDKQDTPSVLEKKTPKNLKRKSEHNLIKSQQGASKSKPLTKSQFLIVSTIMMTFLVAVSGSNFLSSLDKIPFTCDNGDVVNIGELTDGKYDCLDGSDEDHKRMLIDGLLIHIPSSEKRAENYTGYDDGEGETTIFGVLFLFVVPASVFFTHRARKRNQTQFSIVLISIILMVLFFSDFDENQTWECENGDEILNVYFHNDGYVHCLDGTDEIDGENRMDSGPSPVADWIGYWVLFPIILGIIYAILGVIYALTRRFQRKTPK